jgi:hypothetical protein
MRAICCAILALVFLGMTKLKLSGARVTENDVKWACRYIYLELAFVIAAVVLCVFGL